MKIKASTLIQKQMVAAVCAVSLTALVAHYLSLAHSFWEVLTAVLILQTSHVRNLRKAAARFIAIVVGAITVCVLLWFEMPVSLSIWVVMIIAMLFFLIMYFTHFREKNISVLALISLQVVLFTPLILSAQAYAILHDIGLGAIVGGVLGFVILPARVDADYRLGVVPLLQLYRDYLSSLSEALFHKEDEVFKSQMLRESIEAYWVLHVSFPDWVYEPGFSVHFQEGQRYFLLKLEQVGQILFALHYTVQTGGAGNNWQALEPAVHQVLNNAQKTLMDLQHLLELKTVEPFQENGLSDLQTLESGFKTLYTDNVGLFDITPARIHSMGLMYQLKDLYNTLADLREAIR